MTRQILHRLSSGWITAVALILIVLGSTMPQHSLAQQNQGFEGIQIPNPNSDLWRDVRQRGMPNQGTTQIKGVDSDILINANGDKWARFRNDTLITAGLILIGAVLLIILLFNLLRGRVNIEGGLSGNMIFRFTDYERIVHWVLALLFLYLAITGLILLFGRSLLIPILGHEAFSVIASSSKESHNLIGPLFLVSLVMMLISFMRRNIYEKGDLTWLLKFGGFIGKGHVSGGFFNMGEKTWYWIVILAGLLISITGIILVSPNWGQGREIMELAHILHVGAALILITISIGHMYLGSVGTEGTFEGIKNGYVDIKWAEAHHDRWAKHCHDNKLIISAEEYQRIIGVKQSAKMEKSSD